MAQPAHQGAGWAWAWVVNGGGELQEQPPFSVARRRWEGGRGGSASSADVIVKVRNKLDASRREQEYNVCLVA